MKKRSHGDSPITSFDVGSPRRAGHRLEAGDTTPPAAPGRVHTCPFGLSTGQGSRAYAHLPLLAAVGRMIFTERRRPVKRSTTPTFLLELPLRVDTGQAGRLRAHFESARCLYNALLGEAMKRLRRMRAGPRWQEARAIPRAQKQEPRAAFSALRREYGFSEYALHAFAKEANRTWIADHIDFMLAQTLATRAYRAANRGLSWRSKGSPLQEQRARSR